MAGYHEKRCSAQRCAVLYIASFDRDTSEVVFLCLVKQREAQQYYTDELQAGRIDRIYQVS